MKRLISAVLAGLSLLLSGQAQATVTTYNFTGKIWHSDAPLQGLYALGSTYSGSFTIDDSMAPTTDGVGNLYDNSFTGSLQFASHQLQIQSGSAQVLNFGMSPIGAVSLLTGLFWNGTVLSDASIDGLMLVGLNIRLDFYHPFDPSFPLPSASLINDPAELQSTQLGIVYYKGGDGPLEYVSGDLSNLRADSAIPEPGALSLMLLGSTLLLARRRAATKPAQSASAEAV